jgi:ParB family transcriptional regulator, chromosome partitioning protein
MTNANFREVALGEIAPSPMNPRKDFAGEKFAELVESIKQKGVIEPIIIRPVNGKKPFEIVAGERRFKASIEAGLQEIPAIIRELSDDEAYDFMLIENLQRQDLTEREEAESFKAYVGRHGKDAVKDLAEKTGIRPAYIRGRLAVLALPKDVLEAWANGTIRFGHCQQLLRISDKAEQLRFFKRTLQDEMSVSGLKNWIDRQQILLSAALFPSAKECHGCRDNSQVQEDLFGLGAGKPACLDPGCFKEKQAAWLKANWEKSTFKKSHKTNGFAFDQDLGYSAKEAFGKYEWSKKPAQKCFACENFVTLIEVNGKVNEKQACLKPACYRDVGREKTAVKKPANPGGARASWHGEYFRDQFFCKRIPEELAKLEAEGKDKFWYLLLAVAIHGNKMEFRNGHDYSGWILKKPAEEARKTLLELVRNVVLSGQHVGPSSYNGFGTKGRRLVAEFLGIDLAKEYAVDEEYLQKKTKAEIIKFIRDFKLLDDPKIHARREKEKRFRVAADNIETLKKADLVDLILKSGIDLVGMVPDEVLKAGAKP